MLGEKKRNIRKKNKFVHNVTTIINNYASLTQNSCFLAVEFQENVANEVKDKYGPDETGERHKRFNLVELMTIKILSPKNSSEKVKRKILICCRIWRNMFTMNLVINTNL